MIKTKNYASFTDELNKWKREQKEKIKEAKEALKKAEDKRRKLERELLDLQNSPDADPTKVKKSEIRVELADFECGIAEGEIHKLEFMLDWEGERKFILNGIKDCKEELKHL